MIFYTAKELAGKLNIQNHQVYKLFKKFNVEKVFGTYLVREEEYLRIYEGTKNRKTN